LNRVCKSTKGPWALGVAFGREARITTPIFALSTKYTACGESEISVE
jgi:hypothetical protein